MNILLVEDNYFYNHYVTTLLKEANYVVYSTNSAGDALLCVSEINIDIAIIDIGLPDTNGLQLVSQLRRSRFAFPIIMLTACTAWQNKVDGLEAGADDYLVKPFQKNELLARLHALMRRTTVVRTSKLAAGDYIIDLARKEVKIKDNIVFFTSLEYQTLEFLMRNSRQLISKQQLLTQLYGNNDEHELNIVEVMVSRVRKKLMRDDAVSPIATIRYKGYIFTLPCYQL